MRNQTAFRWPFPPRQPISHLFVDKVRVTFRGGRGGDGCVSFRREKYIPKGGPDGGDGGKGGDVYLAANPRLRTLFDLSLYPHQYAPSGEHGKGSKKTGKSGEDLIVPVPCGAMVFKDGKFICDLAMPSHKFLVARGGRGGLGNTTFKNSINQAPRFCEKGEEPEEQVLDIELKLIADVGLVGMPNAGKSTLLSRITRANPKIAAYPFTTLHPNLGLASIGGERFVVADLPGLIEGAHSGRGLGHEFLKHVERTRILVHVLDVQGYEGRSAYESFRIINEELKVFSPNLAAKPQIVAVNKMDITDAEQLVKEFKKKSKIREVYPISAVTGKGINALLWSVVRLLGTLPPVTAFIEHEIQKPSSKIVLEPKFTVKHEKGVYLVTGKDIERLAGMKGLEHREAIVFLNKRLKTLGLERALRRSGAVPGDTVRIGRYEFTLQV